MTGTVWSLIAAALAFAILDWLATILAAHRISAFTEAAVLGLLLAAAVRATGAPGGAQPWLVAALACAVGSKLTVAVAGSQQLAAARQSSAGALLSHTSSTPSKTRGYLGGVGRTARYGGRARSNVTQGASLLLTLVALAMYGLAMQRHGFDEMGVTFGLILVLLTIFALGYRVLLGAQVTGGRGVAVLVAVYMATLGSVVVIGIATSSLLIAYGTLTLATSDVVQAGHQFVAPRQWAPPVIAATSQLAQVALLIGLLR